MVCTARALKLHNLGPASASLGVPLVFRSASAVLRLGGPVDRPLGSPGPPFGFSGLSLALGRGLVDRPSGWSWAPGSRTRSPGPGPLGPGRVAATFASGQWWRLSLPPTLSDAWPG